MHINHPIRPEVFDAARRRAHALRSQAMAELATRIWRRLGPALRPTPARRTCTEC